MPASASSTSYLWGGAGIGCGVRTPGTGTGVWPGLRTPVTFPPLPDGGFPVYSPWGLSPQAARKHYLPHGCYLPGPSMRLSRAFLSIGFHGDLGRPEIRQSFRQLCRGKQEAGRREAGQHRPAPPRWPSASDVNVAERDWGVPWAQRPMDSHRGEFVHRCRRESPGPQLCSKKNNDLATGLPMS